MMEWRVGHRVKAADGTFGTVRMVGRDQFGVLWDNGIVCLCWLNHPSVTLVAEQPTDPLVDLLRKEVDELRERLEAWTNTVNRNENLLRNHLDEKQVVTVMYSVKYKLVTGKVAQHVFASKENAARFRSDVIGDRHISTKRIVRRVRSKP